jgi:hypothetical protein
MAGISGVRDGLRHATVGCSKKAIKQACDGGARVSKIGRSQDDFRWRCPPRRKAAEKQTLERGIHQELTNSLP